MSSGADADPRLVRLAELFGIAARYIDARDEPQAVSPETLRALLAVLGVEVSTPAEAEAAETAERRRRAALVVEPVAVWREETAPAIELADRRELDDAAAELVLVGEEGETISYALADLRRAPAATGRRTIELPGALAYGVYGVHVSAPSIDADSTLLVAPPHLPPATRGWGVFAATWALRGTSDLGIGTYGDLAACSRMFGERGAGVIATLPLYALHEGPRVETSPYLPASRLALNPLLLDLDALVREHGDRAAADELASLHGRAGGDPRTVDYDAHLRAVTPLLRRLAELAEGHRGWRAEIDAFYLARADLAAFCADRAARDQHATGLDEIAELRLQRYLQFAAARQLRRACEQRCGLLLDLPIGVHPDGFDARHFSSSFAAGVNAGAPPDPFQDKGQDWGFRPQHPEHARLDGYAYLRACLRSVLDYARVLRLDHVMSLERLWWIPEGAEATDGAYVASHSEELRALVAIEATRVGAAIVGEDLGTVSPSTRRAMDDEEMLHCAVLQFMLDADQPVPRPPRRSVASIGTHDLPRFATWWRGAGGEEEPGAGAALRRTIVHELAISLPPAPFPQPDPLRTPEVMEAAFGALVLELAESDADLVMVDLEDLWLEEEPINRPGTTEAGNWRRRMARTIAEIARDPAIEELLDAVATTRSAQ